MRPLYVLAAMLLSVKCETVELLVLVILSLAVPARTRLPIVWSNPWRSRTAVLVVWPNVRFSVVGKALVTPSWIVPTARVVFVHELPLPLTIQVLLSVLLTVAFGRVIVPLVTTTSGVEEAE